MSEAKFKIGDRVKFGGFTHTEGVVTDAFVSQVNGWRYELVADNNMTFFAHEDELTMVANHIQYSFEVSIEDNVVVVEMNATQGLKTWCHARGHGHVLHDGAVGVAQAVSYAAKRMFEALDTKQENKIYFKDQGGNING